MIAKMYVKLVVWAGYLIPIALLLVRLSWGWKSAEQGHLCLNHLPQAANYLESMHIPFPSAAAIALGWIELICGWMLMVGLASRLGGLLLAVTYLLSMFAANHDDIMRLFSQPPDRIINGSDFAFFTASLIILALGPGIFSVDALLKKTIFKKHAGALK